MKIQKLSVNFIKNKKIKNNLNFGQMEINMKDNLKMEKDKEMAYSYGLMEINIMVNGTTI